MTAKKDFNSDNPSEIPVLITSEKDRAEYLAAHYWDKSNFEGTVSLSDSGRIENAYVSFMQILQQPNIYYP